MSDESQYRECEFCKNDIPILNFGLHGATCRRHHVKCEKCGEFVSQSGREDHEQMNHSLERCEKCGTTYKPIDKAIHFSVCRFSSVSCEFCDSSVIRKDFSEHQEACGARTERCENCDRYVMLKDTQTHVCRPVTQHDFTERIGNIFSSNLETRNDFLYHQDLPFVDSRNLSRNTEFTDPIRATLPLVPFQTTPPIEPPNFVSLSPLEYRLPQDGDSNSTGLQSELERDPTAPCEFCGNQVPLLALDGHQEQCKFRRYITETETKYCLGCKVMIPEMEMEEHSRVCQPRSKSEKFNQPIGSHYSRRHKLEPKPEPTPLHSSSMVPCEFCNHMFEFSEILTHQTICPERNVPMEFGPISHPEIICSFCKKYFEDFEIRDHRKYCISKPRTETETKCQFCLITFSLEKLPRHLEICSKKSEQVSKLKCYWCLTYFEEDLLSDHENSCSYRNVRSRRGIHDLELPFGDNKPSLKLEREKIETIDNKCPFCRFPQPAFLMEDHKNKCAKNPKYRKKVPSSDISPTPDEFVKAMSPKFISSRLEPKMELRPELRTELRPVPRPEPKVELRPELRTEQKLELRPELKPVPRLESIKIDSKTHEKAPKSETETERNPFSRDQSNTRKLHNTQRTMDTISGEFNDPRFSNKQEPYKSTKTTTTTTTKYPASTSYSLYSHSDPSPKQQKYEHKQQQTDTIKDPIPKYSHRIPSPSPTELFRNKTETNLAFNDLITDNNNLRFVPSSNQFKCELKNTLVPLTTPLQTRSNKPDTIPLSHTSPTDNKNTLTPTQDTSFPFQMPSSRPISGPVLSSSLPRAHYTDTNTSYKPEPKYNKSEPAHNKLEVSSYEQKQTSFKAEPKYNKPEPTPYKPEPNVYKPQRTYNKPEPTPNESEPTPYKPEPNVYKPGRTYDRPELTSYKPELRRKSSPSQNKYPRHTSPKGFEMDYPKSPVSGYTSKERSFERERERDISYPPGYNSKGGYTRTSSSGTETIVEPAHSIAPLRKTPTDFSQRYKQTLNYK